jgi:hypothetical protein
MALTSPGVQVSVVDESFYTPAEPGTVPMIFVASAENKTNAAGTGVAPGTLKANAGRPYLLTSQRDLTETFGDPIFYTDNNNNPIHAGELNEYGLQAAYSLLGVSNRAYVVRADINLGSLQASATPPAAEPEDGTVWLDAQTTSWGIFEWNGNAATVPGGQSFAVKTPIVITDKTRLDGEEDGEAPKGSIGSIGDYAIVATSGPGADAISTTIKLYFKTPGGAVGVTAGAWVEVGSAAWKASWPTIVGDQTNSTIVTSSTMTINGVLITVTGTTLTNVATAINNGSPVPGVSAAVVDGALELYNDGSITTSITVAEGTGLAEASGLLPSGTATRTFPIPALAIAPHTQVPQWKTADANRPTGSIWVKTTEPNRGARWRARRWNADTALFEAVEAPIYDTNHAALYALDRAGGGANLAFGDLYVQSNITEAASKLANFKIFTRAVAGRTNIVSARITGVTADTYELSISESITGQADLANTITVSVTTLNNSGDADRIATAINAAGFVNLEASVDTQNRVTISHKTGGDFRIVDADVLLPKIGMAVYISSTSGTPNLYSAPNGAANTYLASGWAVLGYEASTDAPTSLTADGALWYNSIVDEIDILVHDGSKWVGYQSATSPFYSANPTLATDPAGPIVSASEPTLQSDGTALVNGDIWVSTADLENFPTIYKYNSALVRWDLVDKSDQTTEDGILFADARYGSNGANSDDPADIVELLSSTFVDFDAPDPALYPQGMLLWNLRRSGFNVKKFVRNYVNTAGDNIRFNNGESMSDYYPHRWVTESGNQEDGSGSFGRKAQRKVIVQSLQAMLNSNDAIRDDESRVFNIMACPGYSELIGEMISLNYDRGLGAFILGDSPARLTPDATSLNEWGTNVNLAVEDNDRGLVSRDEYLGVFYPWGFTSDNAGNNVVVPPSHMMLRTIALSDQVSYPWFAPAGIRRGGITNATATGYVDDEGEFVSIALNEGQRDTLYSVSVNPITFITGAGLVAYGQKTRARGSSALDRINVARLVIYLRSQLNRLAKPYIFEPNDKITRDQIKQAAESLMLELVGSRALYDYLVVCDESNNTPNRIDRNELYLDIAIEPVKAVEFIYIPLRLKNTGEIAGL